MQKNVASQKLIVFAFDSTNNLPKTGDAANLTAYVSKDYGSITVLGDTSATEMDATNAKGYYLFDLTQAETNADTLLFSAKSSTANIVVVGAPAAVFTTPPNFSLALIDGSGRVTVGAMANGTIAQATFASDVPSLAMRAGTAQAGDATHITLDAGASSTNNFYNNTLIYITGGTGVGQSRFISAYSGLTKVATVATWVVNPDNTSTFVILPFDSVAGATAPTAAQVATAVWQDTTAGDFTLASSIGKSVMNGVALGTGLTISSVTGSVGSVVGNIGGNLSGNVGGSVVGSVGSVVGSVGSVSAGVTISASQLFIKKNIQYNNFPFTMVLSDGVTPATGKTVTATRSIDGAAFATSANAVTEISNGWYKLTMAAGDVNGTNIAWKFTASGCKQRDILIVTQA